MSLSASHAHRKRTPENSDTARRNRAKRTPFFKNPAQSFFRPVMHIQPKLSVNKPNDIYEKEADAVADKVMRMSNSFFKPLPAIQNKIQCQDQDAGSGDYDPRLDWFEMSRPFYTRGAQSLLYLDYGMYDSIGNAWTNNYQFFFNFGLGDQLSADAANFFTPFTIDAALNRDFPTASELFERENDISSIILNPTLFNFDIHNIPGTLRFPFLKIFGVDQPNPYAPVQRKCAECGQEEKESLHRKHFVHRNKAGEKGVNDWIAASLRAAKGSGRPLPDDTRFWMENRMGADFSDVRVHTDNRAMQLNRKLSAQAFTYGSDIYFNRGKFAPETNEGKRLLAHELTHTVQQGSSTQAASIQREEDPRVEAIKEKLRQGGELSDEDMAYLKEHIGKEIVEQVMGSAGQIIINYDSSRPPEDINRRFQGRLELRMDGLPKAVAGSFEGVATADIDLVATQANEKAVITVSPPEENNRMAATIRQQIFHHGLPRSFDFDFPKEYFKYANSIWLISGITVSLTGPDVEASNAMIRISHESIPEGVELIMTLSPSARSTSVEETERELPGDHWLLTPSPRIFGAIGYGYEPGSSMFTGSLGADFPLVYDTTNPLLYAGLGIRGGANTQGSGRVGGTAFAGVNLDPLSLQLGFGMGAAFLPSPIATEEGPAQTVLYNEVEGMVAYKILSNMELLTILSVGGGENLPSYGTAQIGAGYKF